MGGGTAQEAGVAAEDGAEHVESQFVGVDVRDAGKNHESGLDGCLADIDDFLFGEVWELVGGLLGEGTGGPDAEFVADEPFGLGGLEVAHEDEGHVVGDVVGVEETLHLAGLRIFEVLGETYDIAAVGVVAERLGEYVAGKGLHLLVVVHVLLLVDGFELALEEAEDGVAETLDVDVHPVAELVGGEGVVVDGIVVGGAGVEACTAHVL